MTADGREGDPVGKQGTMAGALQDEAWGGSGDRECVHVLEQRRPEMSSRVPQGLLACFEAARVRLTANIVNVREHDFFNIAPLPGNARRARARACGERNAARAAALRFRASAGGVRPSSLIFALTSAMERRPAFLQVRNAGCLPYAALVSLSVVHEGLPRS